MSERPKLVLRRKLVAPPELDNGRGRVASDTDRGRGKKDDAPRLFELVMFGWLDNGAEFHLCGRRNPMAPGPRLMKTGPDTAVEDRGGQLFVHDMTADQPILYALGGVEHGGQGEGLTKD